MEGPRFEVSQSVLMAKDRGVPQNAGRLEAFIEKGTKGIVQFVGVRAVRVRWKTVIVTYVGHYCEIKKNWQVLHWDHDDLEKPPVLDQLAEL